MWKVIKASYEHQPGFIWSAQCPRGIERGNFNSKKKAREFCKKMNTRKNSWQRVEG